MSESASESSPLNAVAVYCGSSPGIEQAYRNAAKSLGAALAQSGRPLVYGGGRKGIMGVVSDAVLEAGGHLTGVIPYAMVAAGGEKAKTDENDPKGWNSVNEVAKDKCGISETIVVNTMHERKLVMAKQVCGFIGLPGGFGTFEEILEVTTWTQLGIHTKPVVVLNVLSFFEPLRQMIRNGVKAGFIQAKNENLIVFIDGPSDQEEHESFDWGMAALIALDEWRKDGPDYNYDWSKRLEAGEERRGERLDAI